MKRVSIAQNRRFCLAQSLIICLCLSVIARADTAVQSPDGRNIIRLHVDGEDVLFAVERDGRVLVGPSPLGPELARVGKLGEGARVVDVDTGQINETFTLPWGKTRAVLNQCAFAFLTLEGRKRIAWQVELRAYNDGVAFRYHLLPVNGARNFTLEDEATRFDIAGRPGALFNSLDNFTTSHETLYEHKPIDEIPVDRLLDCPLLLTWSDKTAAAITEARVLQFAGMYLRRESRKSTALHCRLSPLPGTENVSVTGETPHTSPWRVVLLADHAGKLLESNLLLCLNDPPKSDFSWAKPGKSTFHWWYGEFEEDYRLPNEREVYVARHKRYIDFCAENKIAYHAVSGDGYAWYQQSRIDYGTPADDADILTPRPEIGLPQILEYARKRGVGIRLWVHWKPLSENLEAAFTRYEEWGVKGLMVDFLDRDDQQMIDFTQRMLESAARHKLHIQIHGSSKYSGEQRTYPNLFNREGVLNLEYTKWSSDCTPAQSVNVAYTRALAGPVDFHLGGFRCVTREKFQPRMFAPVVMGTRCHNMALYIVYENPMPMVADAPSAYVGQRGFEFITQVPTTWDETRFVAGEPGEYVVVARRKDDTWYLGGITNWSVRSVAVPLDFLSQHRYACKLYYDGLDASSDPNDIDIEDSLVDAKITLHISVASGGGFAAVLRPE